ncbi:MAG: hypothetical protein JXO22_01725 [Phycisphaerae bacterium]|nr:hypothetical protein [Phycisphaerae bacterium]
MDENVIIRDTCVCGKHYRIRHPSPGFTFKCPACQREITITEADILVAPPDIDAGVQIQSPDDASYELLEAIPLGQGLLRPAAHGSKQGAVHKVAYDNEDAMVANALAGRPIVNDAGDDEPVTTTRTQKLQVQRDFLGDLFASLYFAGFRDNIVNFCLLSAAIAILWILFAVIPIPFKFFLIPLPIFAAICTMAFFWRTLGMTARGEDEMPWVDSDWGFWGDAIKPAFWILMICLLCCIPCFLVMWFVPASYAPRLILAWTALALGFYFWPVAVMSVALGETILFVRPDWLVRCVIGIGPVYLVAWIMTMVMLGGWALAFAVHIPTAMTVSMHWALRLLLGSVLYPLVWTTLNLYFGYVVFRTLGLLFRHFRTRLPWKF